MGRRQLEAHEFDQFADQRIEVVLAEFHVHRPDGEKEVNDDAVQPVDLFRDHGEVFFDMVERRRGFPLGSPLFPVPGQGSQRKGFPVPPVVKAGGPTRLQRLLDQLDVDGNGTEWILDLVRDACGQRRQAREGFCAPEPRLLPPFFRDVLGVHQGARHPLVLHEGKDADRKQALDALGLHIELAVHDLVAPRYGLPKESGDSLIFDRGPNGPFRLFAELQGKDALGCLVQDDQVVIRVADEQALGQRVQDRLQPFVFRGDREEKGGDLFRVHLGQLAQRPFYEIPHVVAVRPKFRAAEERVASSWKSRSRARAGDWL